MKIGIIGSRGIPNHYGGFEQFAERFSVYAAAKGHEVAVYCSSLHPNRDPEFCGVKRIQVYDAENRIGSAGQFVYDLNCTMDARNQGFDVLLQLGYTSSSVWNFLIPASMKLITNMDGMEWKRSKYNALTKLFLKQAESLAVKHSSMLIADSIAIADYLNHTYDRKAVYIPYGADLFEQPDERILKQYGLLAFSYHLLIARMEPENNVEMIIQGQLQSGSPFPLLIVGNTTTAFGKYIRKKYESPLVRFTEGIYDHQVLNNLRHFSRIYFHGHSVGGTNPSLLEAMAAGALIAAHENLFNQYVLSNNAFYFRDASGVAQWMLHHQLERETFVSGNLHRIQENYTWTKIHNQVLAQLTALVYA
ncbi:MAG: DUF1972 domain-containing protein [Bacteroidia bacterium]|jgi:hypothetical protein